jgi:phosphocarrier protein HPr
MITKQAIIRNEAGIHCRPSAVIVREFESYAGEIQVRTKDGSVDCRSVMGLLTLGLEQNMHVTVQVEGPDEETVCRKLVELLETEYDFPDARQGD